MGWSAALRLAATVRALEAPDRPIPGAAMPRGAALAGLRERTRTPHYAIERELIIGRPDAGREEYARHVAALWGWMTPIEAMLWRGPWPAGVSVGSRAVKTRWLECDIAVAREDGFLGGDLDVSGDLAEPSPAARFGIAYVVEGSMLGGVMLLRRLGPRLAPWPARYLRGYGIHGPRFWGDFLEALDRHVTSAADVDEAADAAVQAFDSLARWMHGHRGAQ